MKHCLLRDDDTCTKCGECDRCDLDEEKLCDNCCKCIESSADFRQIGIDSIETHDKREGE